CITGPGSDFPSASKATPEATTTEKKKNTDNPEPGKYVWLPVHYGFIPSFPNNLVAFVFIVISCTNYNSQDIEATKKFGRNAKWIKISVSIIILLIVGCTCGIQSSRKA
uniref:Uncharacterized protein n=1 Tax=Sus scrofa TaxID=9823 RepID=A0A8D0XLI6_PIG